MTAERVRRTARRSTPARSLPAVVGRFIRTEAAGGLALVTAATIALVWANSPWSDAYEALWHTAVVVEAGPLRVAEDLQHLVNDGLMALFFFVVGLEIKREVVRGELADLRVAALPVLAAVGGMLVPAVLYVAVAGGGAGGHGWGIPMATDIAFALGVLALLGSRIPPSLKLFLLTLAIVDDIGAIVVIALFYGGDIDPVALAVATLAVVASWGLRRARIDWPPIYIGLALVAWYATYHSGVHATIAGVALALTTPAKPVAPAHTARRWAQDLSDEPTAGELHQMSIIARQSVSPAEHLEELLHPTTSFLVLPAFALANAGVELRSGMLAGPGTAAVAAGVAVGLLVGKFVGILAGAWLGVRFGPAIVPAGLRWRHIAGAAALGGIGFTVSLFIAELAFEQPALADAGRVAILSASVIAATLGVVILASSSGPTSSALATPTKRPDGVTASD